MIYASHSLEVDAFPGKKKRSAFPPTGLTSVTVMERSLGFAESLCSDRPETLRRLTWLFFHDTRRHWFSNSIFAFYPATRPSVEPPSILEFSTFPSRSPAPFRRILRLRIFAATRNTLQRYIDAKIIRGISAQ